MKHFEGYSVKEIAEQTRLSARAIEDRLYRMSNFLKTRKTLLWKFFKF
jgi:predicted DNA-binding protein YlxM (UPF0122 family)